MTRWPSAKPTGTAITRAVMDLLATYRDIEAWRQNTGAAKFADASGRERFVRFGRAGAADITGIVGPWGRRLEIEIKAEGDRLRPDQVAFGERITECGGIYLVVSDPADVMRALGVIGVKR